MRGKVVSDFDAVRFPGAVSVGSDLVIPAPLR